jgi:hypothetical protein
MSAALFGAWLGGFEGAFTPAMAAATKFRGMWPLTWASAARPEGGLAVHKGACVLNGRNRC